jgi:hypothetical protein
MAKYWDDPREDGVVLIRGHGGGRRFLVRATQFPPTPYDGPFDLQFAWSPLGTELFVSAHDADAYRSALYGVAVATRELRLIASEDNSGLVGVSLVALIAPSETPQVVVVETATGATWSGPPLAPGRPGLRPQLPEHTLDVFRDALRARRVAPTWCRRGGRRRRRDRAR